MSKSVEARDEGYNIFFTIVGDGYITFNGTLPCEAGSVVLLGAYPFAGSQFDCWGGDLRGSTTPKYLLMDGDKSVIAYFSEIPEYVLSVTIVGQGSVAMNGSSPYEAGSTVVLTACPDTDWQFDCWGGNLGGSTNPETLLMDSNKNVTVYFSEIQDYYLTLGIESGQGQVSWNGSNPYLAGDVVRIEASPYAGWEFSGWSVDLTGTTNPVYLTMDSNKTVTCTFTEIPEYPPVIESYNSTEAAKDSFEITENVYLIGTGYSASTTYDLYVVADQAVWSDNMAIPSPIYGTAITVSSDAVGNIPPTLIWASPLPLGKYDVVVDVNANGKYDVLIDALDDNDIDVTAGFLVVPEASLGMLGAFAVMIIGSACYYANLNVQKKK